MIGRPIQAAVSLKASSRALPAHTISLKRALNEPHYVQLGRLFTITVQTTPVCLQLKNRRGSRPAVSTLQQKVATSHCLISGWKIRQPSQLAGEMNRFTIRELLHSLLSVFHRIYLRLVYD